MANSTKNPTTGRRKLGQSNDHDYNSITKVFLIVLALSVLIVAVYIQVVRDLTKKYGLKETTETTQTDRHIRTSNTLVVAENMNAGYLEHVVQSLLDFGHSLTFKSAITINDESTIDSYNLIWTHDYPFSSIKKLLPNQRVNHFPGTGFITNKMTLSTTPKLNNILKAFRLPLDREQFFKHVQLHKDTVWVQKSSSHRGISIETADSVNLNLNETLVQEYMKNPLLIDGKKFDIGIYASLTSVEPLRAYIYESEALLRFCARPYYDSVTGKFNSSDLDSFVVGDDYTPIWLMPSFLRYYIGSNLSMKQALNAYLNIERHKDGSKIWQQIEQTIKQVYKSKEHLLARMSRMYQASNNYNSTFVRGSLNQFFEMVRFDFIVDEDLNVYLMEANMSPNLSSHHFPPNRLIYEQVLNSYFSLAGLDQFAQNHLYDLPSLESSSKLNRPKWSINQELTAADLSTQRLGLEKLVSEKELSVYEELCSSNECHMNCSNLDCKICYFCLDDDQKLHLRRAIYEQKSRWNFKRILPSTLDDDLDMQLRHPDGLSQSNVADSNYIHVQWFRGKCYSDARFCSY